MEIPYFDNGGSAKDYPKFKPEPNSIDKAISSLKDWISNTGTYKSSFVYTTMMQKLPTLSEQERLSFAIRLLIHYVGDIH